MKTDLAGIGAVAGVAPGDDLLAPAGAIDAGAAGIRSTGKLNIAMNVILNASNIQASPGSPKTPEMSVYQPAISITSQRPQQQPKNLQEQANKQAREDLTRQAEAPVSFREWRAEDYCGEEKARRGEAERKSCFRPVTKDSVWWGGTFSRWMPETTG